MLGMFVVAPTMSAGNGHGRDVCMVPIVLFTMAHVTKDDFFDLRSILKDIIKKMNNCQKEGARALAVEMDPHPDSLRSRYAAKSAISDKQQPEEEEEEEQQQQQQQQQSFGTLALPMLFGPSRIGTPLCSQLSTPRDASSNHSIGFKERANMPNCRRTFQQRSGVGTAKDLESHLLEHGITPIYHSESWTNVPLLNTLDASDVRSFVSQPALRGCGPIQCYIHRHFNANWLSPRYDLYLSDGDRFLLCARNRKKSMSSNYTISLDPDDISKNTGNFFGKIRSNFLGTEFWFYNKGSRHTLEKSFGLSKQAELGAVTYGKNLLGLGGPRKMTAIIPAVSPVDDKPFVFQPILPSASHSMLIKYRSGQDQSKMLVMHNKQPAWNKKLNAYCLNFQGRATKPSVKNFQLVADADQDYVILQFGKIGNDIYNVDYQHPMSALQAFAICLTSLDYKIACE